MIKNVKRKEKGQSLVELALSITLMAFLLLGAIDFGFAYLYYIAIRDAAQEGAAYGSLHPAQTSTCQTDLRNWVRGASTSPLVKVSNIPDGQITITQTGTNVGDAIKVQVTYYYNVLTPFPGLPSTITLTTSVTNTILQTLPCS